MTWTKLSDTFTDNPDFLEMSRSARLLHIEALVWCNRHGRDGRVPASAIPRFTDAEDVGAAVNELAKAGFWTNEEEGVWLIDWSDQELAADVKERRYYRAEVQRAYRDRVARHARGDHSKCLAGKCPKVPVTGNAVSNETGHETPSRPDPSRPLGRDRDRGVGQAGSAGAPPAAGLTEGRWSDVADWGGEWVDAHEFLPDENGKCINKPLYTVTAGTNGFAYECMEVERSWRHSHQFMNPAGGKKCDTCCMPALHPVHRGHR